MSTGLPTVTITIRGTSPYAQARKDNLDQAKARKSAKGAEAQDAYDYEHAADRLTVNPDTGNVAVPGFGLRMAIVTAAQRMGEKFKGNQTWGKKFVGGTAIFDAFIDTGVPAVIGAETERGKVFLRAINAHANGQRGSGSRVTRYVPHIHPGWEATFDLSILDNDLTSDAGKGQIERAVRNAGLIIGIGQYRPENFGTNGRFEPVSFNWSF